MDKHGVDLLQKNSAHPAHSMEFFQFRSDRFRVGPYVTSVLPICSAASLPTFRCSRTRAFATVHSATAILHGRTPARCTAPGLRAASLAILEITAWVSILQPAAAKERDAWTIKRRV